MTSEASLSILIDSVLEALRSLIQTDEVYTETVSMVVNDAQITLNDIRKEGQK